MLQRHPELIELATPKLQGLAKAPDPSLGDDGQYAFQPTTRKYWLKAGGAWVFQGQPGIGDVVAANNLSDVASVMTARANLGVDCANRTLLKALDTTKITGVFLKESGREGVFMWVAGDFSSRIALDTLEGMYIKANSIAANAGAWVRIFNGAAKPEWFGAVGGPASATNGSLPDDFNALQCMLNVVGFTGGAIQITPGRKFRTNTALFARITRQQAAPKTLVADLYISDKSSFKIYSDGSGGLVAGAAMAVMLTFQFNSNVVGGVTNSRSPDQSEVCGIMFDGNSLAGRALKGDFTRGLNLHDNTIFDVTGAGITWTGSAVGFVTDNIIKAPVGIECLAGSGGDLHIGPNQYFFPLTGGRAVQIQNSGNIVIAGGTVNSESITNVIAVDIEATAGNSVRHIVVRDMEWSGCLAGVFAHTATTSERIYGLLISGNHATSGSGFDRPAINIGTICDLQNCDEVVLTGNFANGRSLSVASESAYLLRGCRSVKIRDADVTNYMKNALYAIGCDKIVWDGGDIRDVGQAGASGAIFDLDTGCTNCKLNPSSVTQTNAAYAQIGIIERASASGNSSERVDWTGVGTPWTKTGATNGYFRRFRKPYAEGKVAQTSGGATLSVSQNVASATRSSIGRCAIVFTTAHPDATSYRVNCTGVGCKVEIESPIATGFTILMLDLSDSPVDSSFGFDVISML